MNQFQVPRPSLFSQPNFVRFWAARLLSTIGFQVTAVVVGWQVYALTHSTFALGLVGLMQFLPMVMLTLPAGHVADRYDRRRVVQACQAVEGCAAAVLVIATLDGWIGSTTIFAIVAAIGAARSIESPTTAALLPGVVSAEALPSALALSASAIQTATIVGPALGGVLVIGGAAWAYGAVVVCYAGASLLVGGIKVERSVPRREKASLRALLTGFVYIRDHPMVLGAISLDLFAVLFGGATALLPVYAQDILRATPFGLGLMRAAPAIGALLTSLLIARRPLRHRVGLKMFGAVTLFGLATIVFGLSTSFPLSLMALMVLGASDVISVVVRSSLVQISTPDALRGRVSAVNSLFIGTSNQLGEFESGTTAALFGTVPSVVLGGVGTIVVAMLWSRLFPSLRDAESLSGPIGSGPLTTAGPAATAGPSSDRR